jgi:hypothetical protein
VSGALAHVPGSFVAVTCGDAARVRGVTCSGVSHPLASVLGIPLPRRRSGERAPRFGVQPGSELAAPRRTWTAGHRCALTGMPRRSCLDSIEDEPPRPAREPLTGAVRGTHGRGHAGRQTRPGNGPCDACCPGADHAGSLADRAPGLARPRVKVNIPPLSPWYPPSVTISSRSFREETWRLITWRQQW